MKAKYFLVVLLFQAMCFSSTAQKITLEKEVVLKDGEPVFIIKTTKKVSILDAEGIPEFSIRNLNDKELIYFKDNVLIFMSDGSKANYDGKTKPAALAKHLIDNSLIDAGNINADALKNYLTKFGYKAPEDLPKDANGLIMRNRDGAITITGTQIKQAGTLIGTIKQDTYNTEGRVEWKYDIKLPNGTLVATAYAKDLNTTNVNIVTAKDNKTHYHNFAYAAQMQESVVKYLIQKLYL
jgi:hypothetical protein